MTKDKLKKEAEEYLKKKNYTSGYIGYFASGYCNQAYIDSAEPREKRIGELEQQIEKMKCCGNCANDDKYDFYDDTWHDICGTCENQCNWKLKEIKENG